jgi:hypothetical protein
VRERIREKVQIQKENMEWINLKKSDEMEVALGPRVPVHLEVQAQRREGEKRKP